jgi:hypothetical protein
MPRMLEINEQLSKNTHYSKETIVKVENKALLIESLHKEG